MPDKELLSALSIAIGIAAAFPYVRGIWRRETKPHMFSWLIWALVCSISFAVQWFEGGGAGSWYMAFNATYCLSIAATSYWLGTRDITRGDWIALVTALCAIPIWLITQNPLWSLLIVIGIDAVGYIPTIRKSWNKPHEENATSWFASTLCFFVSILALETYKVTTYLHPATFIVINLSLTALLLTRRRSLAANPVQTG